MRHFSLFKIHRFNALNLIESKRAAYADSRGSLVRSPCWPTTR